MCGHIYRMAEAVAEGARRVPGAKVELLQVPELVPEGVLETSGASAARQKFSHVPIARVEQLSEADAIIFGTPTRFGNRCAQMRNFLDQTALGNRNVTDKRNTRASRSGSSLWNSPVSIPCCRIWT